MYFTNSVSHGIVSGALFLCVGVVYDRLHTREIAAYGGLASKMPLYAVAFTPDSRQVAVVGGDDKGGRLLVWPVP